MTSVNTDYDTSTNHTWKQRGNCREESAAQRLFEAIEMAAANAGFKILDGDDDAIVVRDAKSDTDFAIHINELS